MDRDTGMSYKMIAKFFVFVIFAGPFTGCGFVLSGTDGADKYQFDSPYEPPKVIGNIKSKDITESSGIAASRCQSGVLWTHNDSGDEAHIYAVNGSGESLGVWKAANTGNIDWEDIAAYKDKTGKCFIYIGEIGDNKLIRREHTVYRIPEPLIVPSNAGSSRDEPLITADAEMLRFSYPDFEQDAETLMVHPNTADIYVVTKRVSGPAGVYRIKPAFNNAQAQKAERIADISVPAVPNGLLTGGDISPDGRRIIVCDYIRAYEFFLPEIERNFDNIWKQKPVPVLLGKRKGGESVCYSVDGTSIFATSEGRNSPLIEVKRR